jgi:nucleoside-diphosphate-sugar epimerase
VLLPFDEWADAFPIVTSNVVAGARRSNATVVQPSVAFGYGPFRESPATEDHPREPAGPLGRVRNGMERTVLDAHEAGDVRGVVAVLGEFYGPRTDNEIIEPVFEAVLEGGKAPWLGKRDVPLDMVFIEDAARACVLLATNEDTHGEVWHVPGQPITAERFTRLAGEAAGTDPGLRMASGPVLRLLGLFNADLRAVREVRWLFEEPSLLNDRKFRERFPEFAYTPHEEAIPRAVEWFRERDGIRT